MKGKRRVNRFRSSDHAKKRAHRERRISRPRRVSSISSIGIHLVDSLRSDACSINPVFSAGDLIEIKIHKFAAGPGPFACPITGLDEYQNNGRHPSYAWQRTEMSDAISFRHTRQTCYP
jgi:hypothetical protein